MQFERFCELGRNCVEIWAEKCLRCAKWKKPQWTFVRGRAIFTAQSAVNVGADDSARPSPLQRKMKKPLLLHETEEAV